MRRSIISSIAGWSPLPGLNCIRGGRQAFPITLHVALWRGAACVPGEVNNFSNNEYAENFWLNRNDMARKRTRTARYDSAALLKTPGDIAAYFEAAMEDGDSRVIAAALGNIARAKGMSALARETGLGRETLYKALSPDGNPEFSTILKVVRALGLRLHAEAVSN